MANAPTRQQSDDPNIPFWWPTQPGFVTVSIIVLYGFTLTCLLTRPMPISDSAGTLLTALISIMTAKLVTIVDFHFGSSSSSKDKDKSISDALVAASPAAAATVAAAGNGNGHAVASPLSDPTGPKLPLRPGEAADETATVLGTGTHGEATTTKMPVVHGPSVVLPESDAPPKS